MSFFNVKSGFQLALDNFLCNLRSCSRYSEAIQTQLYPYEKFAWSYKAQVKRYRFKSIKSALFKLLKSQNILMKNSKNAFFKMKAKFQFALVNFLCNLWVCSRHAEASPNVALSPQEKLAWSCNASIKIYRFKKKKTKKCNF